MVTDRLRAPARAPRPARIAVALIAALVALTAPVRAADGPVRLADAGQSGAFNVGAGQASVDRVDLPDGGGPALRLRFDLPPGTAAGVWAKAFPAGLDAEGVDIVRTSIRAEGKTPAAGSIAVALEIKGSAGTQRIPLEIAGDAGPAEHAVEWGRVGALSEVVVAVSRAGDGPAASGVVVLDVRFDRRTWLARLADSPLPRFAAVLAAAGLAALAALVLGSMAPIRLRPARGVVRDAVGGVGVVLVAAVAAAVWTLGEPGAEPGGWPVGLALAGAVVAGWWMVGLAGRWPTPGEAFADALATGWLAAAASPLAVLQAPGSWWDTLRLSQAVAALAVAAYHLLHAGRLLAAGRRPERAAGALVAATPFALGLLVVLSVAGMTRGLGDLLSGGSLADRPEVGAAAGRALILFGFNELVTLGLGLVTRGRATLASVRGHLGLLAVAAAAAVAPDIADLGSGAWAASHSAGLRGLIAVATAAASQAGLWAEVYLVTGLLIDAIGGASPTRGSVLAHPRVGAAKGAIYAGVFLGLLHAPALGWRVPGVARFATNLPIVAAPLFGAAVFPLVKTIFETFDGSQAFFRRVARSYGEPLLFARGAVIGLAAGIALAADAAGWSIPGRAAFGLAAGGLAFGGVNLAADIFGASRGRRRVEPARVYLAQAALGGFIGAALGFYFDRAQVKVVEDKFFVYLGFGTDPVPADVLPLLSKWGRIDLGTEAGGVKVLFDEALAGVISWAIPAWLFAINRTFLAALLERQAAPIRGLFSRDGLAQLVRDMIGVLRWGLWMSPIVKSFLRPTGDPTWYNQDGAIRTGWAIFHDLTTSPAEFRAWSMAVFVALLAYDSVRILIWLDHFGLRVATLVNLSFLGMDRLDTALARRLAPAATARCIPEAVKRFTTWAPLLIPFFIPRGVDWDASWDRSQKIIQANAGPGAVARFAARPAAEQAGIGLGAAVAASALFGVARLVSARADRRRPASWTLRNADYELTLTGAGAITAVARAKGYDLTRRSYDGLDPAGRALFVVDEAGASWPILGQFPSDRAGAPTFRRDGDALRVERSGAGLDASVAIRLDGAAEVWEVTVRNPGDAARVVRVVPYAEWVLNKAEADRNHTQYNRLFAEIEYAAGLHAVLAWDKHAKAMGVLAADAEPAGFLSARVDFIGRARSIRSPRVLETLAFTEPADTDAHPTFDPIGSLLLPLNVPARGSAAVRVVFGLVADKAAAVALIARTLAIPGASSHAADRRRKEHHAIGHGEVPPGTPRPYCEFRDGGRTLRVKTPFTPRPFDHTLSNALGHVVSVTNRGFNTTSSVNAQQNRVTPDWADTVTREVPPEAIYLHDVETQEWFSPTYHPLNDADAAYETDFSVDGTATFRMRKGEIETELALSVAPNVPAGVYSLSLRNHSPKARKLRFGYFAQVVLAGQPEFAGPLQIRRSDRNGVLLANPRNTYRTGPAFAATSAEPSDLTLETRRGRFFGPARDVARPEMVRTGRPSAGAGDDRPIAAFVAVLDVPAGGEVQVDFTLGQAATAAEARAAAPRVAPDRARQDREATRAWWLALMDTLTVRTADPEFDAYLDWLKYQALAERIWARRGFYQSSGAFGFRDQLQDSVNLLWVDPAIARRQIILHSAQQFPEGDVVHWFHQLQDGRTGFVGRSHASDNLLWLGWAVVEYVGATGDDSLLQERTTDLASELPFPPLPAGKHGMGFDPLRSSRESTVYGHALRAIDLVLDGRMGAHGLPLMGTGDWNDGLDEIGSEGRGESVWLALFLHYILERMIPIVGRVEGDERRAHYQARLDALGPAIEKTWRGDRYLRAIHDDGTEIGVKGSGVWEIDALTAAWAVMCDLDRDRARTVFQTALDVLERDTTILLGSPPLREDTHPYLGRSSWYPEGVRENGMYCHGVQWLVGAARVLADRAAAQGQAGEAQAYRETAYRLWRKIAAIGHTGLDEIETYGGQPNKQAADMVTTFEPGRMIWNGYTGAAGWMLRQAVESVLGYRLDAGKVILPAPGDGVAALGQAELARDVSGSPFGKQGPA